MKLRIVVSFLILIGAALAIMRVRSTSSPVDLMNIAYYSAENQAISSQYSAIVISAAIVLTALWIRKAARWLAENKEPGWSDDQD